MLKKTLKLLLKIEVIQEIYWAQVFNFAIKNSIWLIKQNFNVGRMALGFPALYVLYRILNDIRPNSILELGLGESTKMTWQYYKSFPDCKLQIIEENQEWLNFFTSEISDIKSNVKVLPLVRKKIEGYETQVYSNLIENISGKKYNLLIIDGPSGSKKYSRSQIIDIINNDLLDNDFVILIDDYHRAGEKQTASKCLCLLQEKGIKYFTATYQGDKAVLVICSEKYRYLKSL